MIEKRGLQVVTVIVAVVTVFCSYILLNYPDLHVCALQKQAQYEAKRNSGYSVMDLMRDETEILEANNKSDIMEGQLRLELPKELDAAEVAISNDYINHTIEIQIPNIGDNYFYDYPMIGTCEKITDITFEAAKAKGYINIVLDSVYEYELAQKDQYLYLTFVNPREIYDDIIVIDAGHGSKDPGATQGDVSEKDIDLAIVKKIKQLFDADERNIGVYYTRLTDSNPSLQARVAFANELEADLFLSVHNNSTASGRISSINGTEVMYRVADETGASKQFAELCLQHMLEALGSQSKGLVAGDEIYIVRESTMPMALVEVGFMTNAEELEKLQQDDYQEDCAKALYDAIIEMLEVANE